MKMVMINIGGKWEWIARLLIDKHNVFIVITSEVVFDVHTFF